MLSSIALQLGGAEPGVESTYWWMGDQSKIPKAPKALASKGPQLAELKKGAGLDDVGLVAVGGCPVGLGSLGFGSDDFM